MKVLHKIAFILVVIGALNWGLVGINPGWNLVSLLLGSWPMVVSVVYILVGLSALVLLFTHKKDCKACETSAAPKV